METKHTPTPWVAVINDSYWTIVAEERGENDPYQIGDVCSSYPGDKDQGLQEANAAHIVKCVNMHDELVEALKYLFTSYKALADSGDAGFWQLEEQEEGENALLVLKKAGAL